MYFQGEITEDSPGQGNVPTKVHRRVNEVQCSYDVLSLTDELWQYALDNFSTVSISLVTKQSAREFHQSILPQSSFAVCSSTVYWFMGAFRSQSKQRDLEVQSLDKSREPVFFHSVHQS